MLITLISSAACLIIGSGIGLAVGMRRGRISIHKNNLAKQETSIPSAFDTRVSMVENACQETKAARVEEKRAYAKACRIVEKSISQVSRLISNRAKRGYTSARVVIRTKDDATKEEGYKSATPSLPKSDDIIYAPRDAMGYVGGLLRDTYGKYGYEANAATDSDWLGHIFVSLCIDWSGGIDPEQLQHIEFSSQVEAFKAGVPLEDILA